MSKVLASPAAAAPRAAGLDWFRVNRIQERLLGYALIAPVALLILVLIACILFGWLSLYASEFKLLGRSIAGGAGFVANIGYFLEAGYWDVSSKLKTKLSGPDEKKLVKNYTVNPEAYQLYLKGRFYWNKRTGEGLKKATEYFNQAIEKDPSFALAYAGLADCYVVPANRMPPREAISLFSAYPAFIHPAWMSGVSSTGPVSTTPLRCSER